MANGKDALTNLINTLSRINMQLEQVNTVLKKIEDNEISITKDNYEFKTNLLGEIMAFEKELQAIKYQIDHVLEKLRVSDDKMGDINDAIKDSIRDSVIRLEKIQGFDENKFIDKVKTEIKEIIEDVVQKGIINQQNKLIKTILIILGILLFLLLTTLGLNVLGVIDLPTMTKLVTGHL